MPAFTLPKTPRSDDREDGFTLIELLVVVIIIGILAAIAIPVYIGVQNSAKDSTLQSDLAAAKTATVAWSQAHPTELPTIGTQLATLGYTPSPYSGAGVAPDYQSGSTSTLFCIVGTSGSGQQYSVTSNSAVRKGFCAFSTSQW